MIIKAINNKPLFDYNAIKSIIRHADNFIVVNTDTYVNEISANKDITTLYEDVYTPRICDFIKDKVANTAVLCIKGTTVQLIASQIFLINFEHNLLAEQKYDID